VRITKSEIRLLRSLTRKKVRDQQNKFVVEGWRALRDALNSDFHVDLVGFTHRCVESPDLRTIINDIDSRGIQRRQLTELEMNQVTDTVHAQGVVAIVQQRSRTLDEVLTKEPSLVVFADRVSDPGNLGTIVRTCDWFGVDAIILSEGCVDLYNEKVVRSTSGSIFHIPVIEHADAKGVVSRLKALNYKILVTSGDAKTSYEDMRYGERNVIIVGNEAAGVRDDINRLADGSVCIPRRGNAESLNVGVACGIILSHLRNGR